MILIDANLLLYAYDRASPHHDRAKLWLESALNGLEPVGFGWVTLLAFLRLTTNPRVFQRPLAVADAVGIVQWWLRLPAVGVVEPTQNHLPLLLGAATDGQARGPMLMDAHVAALAIEHGAMLCTTDRDFARYPGLRLANPLAT